jgi:hypothetical protein
VLSKDGSRISSFIMLVRARLIISPTFSVRLDMAIIYLFLR